MFNVKSRENHINSMFHIFTSVLALSFMRLVIKVNGWDPDEIIFLFWLLLQYLSYLNTQGSN